MKKIFVIFAVLTLLLAACGIRQEFDGPPNHSIDPEPNPGLPDNDTTVESPIINQPEETPFQAEDPDPGQANWSEGNAYVNSADMLIMESYPIQVGLYIEGDLPTPCNHLAVDIAAPDAENNIHVRVYSLINPAETCMQVIEPFSENVSLSTGELADGDYTVFVNGEQVGEFTYPGG